MKFLFLLRIAIIWTFACSLTHKAYGENELRLESPFLLFDEMTEFRFIGNIEVPDGRMQLYFYQRIWGEAGRATRKLVVLCDDRFKGFYALPMPPKELAGRKLIFDLSSNMGRKSNLRHASYLKQYI